MTQLATPHPGRRPEDEPIAISTPVDVYQNDSGFLIRADLPGVDREHVSIEFGDKELRLVAERPSRSFGGDVTTERVYRRTFRIPEDIDADQIDASLDAGVLTVRLPKAQAPQPKKIAIR